MHYISNNNPPIIHSILNISVTTRPYRFIVDLVSRLCIYLLISTLVESRYQEACVFPSLFNKDGLSECVWHDTRQHWWCPTTDNFDTYKTWKPCPNTTNTYAGNDPGKPCHFPYHYNKNNYPTCLWTKSSGGYWWCATTSNYDIDKKWTRCTIKSPELPCHFQTGMQSQTVGIEAECRPFNDELVCRTAYNEVRKCPSTQETYGGNDPGKPCQFPFRIALTVYQHCIYKRRDSFIGEEAMPWCATTEDFDNDRRWTWCKTGSPSVMSRTLMIGIVSAGVIFGLAFLTCSLYYLIDPRSSLRRYCKGDKNQMNDDDDDDLADFRRFRPPAPSNRLDYRVSTPSIGMGSYNGVPSAAPNDPGFDRMTPQHATLPSRVVWGDPRVCMIGAGEHDDHINEHLYPPIVPIPQITPTAPPPPYERVMEGRSTFLSPDSVDRDPT